MTDLIELLGNGVLTPLNAGALNDKIRENEMEENGVGGECEFVLKQGCGVNAAAALI